MFNISKILSCLICGGFIVISAHSVIAETLPKPVNVINNIPPTALDWVKTPEGVAFAALHGDRFTEPYMAMVRLPAGLISPAHTKTANMFGMVVSGSMVHSKTGSDPAMETPLPAGSFYKIPANIPHISKCVSNTECITFLYQDGKFDFLPVSP